MAGLAHLGVGLAAKRVSPRTPLVVLVLCSYTIDIVFGVFALLGLERMPRGAKVVGEAQGDGAQELDPPSPWSHGLFMASVWSTLAGVIARLVTHRSRTGVFIGLLVFSHWVVDFVTQPMRAAFPRQSGIPLLFHRSRRVGLGLYSTRAAVNVGEYGSVALGFALYLWALKRPRDEGAPAGTE